MGAGLDDRDAAFGAQGPQGLDHQVADDPTADHQTLTALGRPVVVDRLQGDGCRFGHDGGFVRERCRNAVELALVGHQARREAPVDAAVDTDEHARGQPAFGVVFAITRPPFPTAAAHRINAACGAAQGGVDDHPVAHGNAGHVGAGFDDPPHNFMAGHAGKRGEGRGRRGVVQHDQIEVAAAEAAVDGLDSDPIGAWQNRVGYVGQSDCPGGALVKDPWTEKGVEGFGSQKSRGGDVELQCLHGTSCRSG